MSTSSEDNKTTWKRFVVEVLNQGNLDALGDFVAADLKWQTPAPGFTGDYEGLEGFLSLLLEAFPDLQYHIEEVVAENDKVVCRATWTGTHRAPFLGVKPTERRVRVSGVDLCRFAEGKIAEHWANFDAYSLMTQLGAVPPPPTDIRLN